MHFIKNEKIKSGIFNAGFENLSILNIAKKIAKVTGCELKVNKNVNDARSYRQNSDKLIVQVLNNYTQLITLYMKYIINS